MEEKIDLEKEFKKINEKSSLKDIQDYMKKNDNFKRIR